MLHDGLPQASRGSAVPASSKHYYLCWQLPAHCTLTPPPQHGEVGPAHTVRPTLQTRIWIMYERETSVTTEE
jgi:hypothetical protein